MRRLLRVNRCLTRVLSKRRKKMKREQEKGRRGEGGFWWIPSENGLGDEQTKETIYE